jgi:amino acid transporter
MGATILVVGFIGIIQAISLGSEARDTARKQQVAIQIIDAEIERLRSGPWSTLSSLAASGTIQVAMNGAVSGDTTRFALTNYTAATTDDNSPLAALAPGFTCNYARTWLRPTAATASTVTFISVTYTLTWTSNTGRTHRRSERAFFSRNGLHLSYQKA